MWSGRFVLPMFLRVMTTQKDPQDPRESVRYGRLLLCLNLLYHLLKHATNLRLIAGILVNSFALTVHLFCLIAAIYL